MKNEDRDPELEQLMKKIRLKEPSQNLMKDYLAGVNIRIDQGGGRFHIEFPQLMVACVAGLALVGAVYLMFVNYVKPGKDPELSVIVSEAPATMRGGSDALFGGKQSTALGQAPQSQAEIASASLGILSRNDEMEAVSQNTTAPSLEDDLAVLEAFAEEYSEDVVELLGDEEVLEELIRLDETELSTPSASQASHT